MKIEFVIVPFSFYRVESLQKKHRKFPPRTAERTEIRR